MMICHDKFEIFPAKECGNGKQRKKIKAGYYCKCARMRTSAMRQRTIGEIFKGAYKKTNV